MVILRIKLQACLNFLYIVFIEEGGIKIRDVVRATKSPKIYLKNLNIHKKKRINWKKYN